MKIEKAAAKGEGDGAAGGYLRWSRGGAAGGVGLVAMVAEARWPAVFFLLLLPLFFFLLFLFFLLFFLFSLPSPLCCVLFLSRPLLFFFFSSLRSSPVFIGKNRGDVRVVAAAPSTIDPWIKRRRQVGDCGRLIAPNPGERS